MNLRLLLGLCLFSVSLARCALPHGSMARPVQPAADGTIMVSGGAMIPFAAAASASSGSNTVGAAGTAGELFVIPHTSLGYAFDNGTYFTLELSSWTSLFITADTGNNRTLALFLNPNFEVPLDGPDRRLSLTIDSNFGYLRSGSGNETSSAPFFAPTIGVRWYVPISSGGLILSQQVGTGFISLALPGSLAFDIPIPIGTSKLHIFPEVRWDPTLIFVGSAQLNWVFFSGGLSFMLEV